MAISGTIYFFVGFGMALIICVVLPVIPKVLNDAIKQIKSEQQKKQDELKTNNVQPQVPNHTEFN